MVCRVLQESLVEGVCQADLVSMVSQGTGAGTVGLVLRDRREMVECRVMLVSLGLMVYPVPLGDQDLRVSLEHRGSVGYLVPGVPRVTEVPMEGQGCRGFLENLLWDRMGSLVMQGILVVLAIRELLEGRETLVNLADPGGQVLRVTRG